MAEIIIEKVWNVGGAEVTPSQNSANPTPLNTTFNARGTYSLSYDGPKVQCGVTCPGTTPYSTAQSEQGTPWELQLTPVPATTEGNVSTLRARLLDTNGNLLDASPDYFIRVS